MTDNNAGGTLINQVGVVFVPVADQDRALGFYLDTLGFEKRADFTYGEDSRWMEVAAGRGEHDRARPADRRGVRWRRGDPLRFRDGRH